MTLGQKSHDPSVTCHRSFQCLLLSTGNKTVVDNITHPPLARFVHSKSDSSVWYYANNSGHRTSTIRIKIGNKNIVLLTQLWWHCITCISLELRLLYTTVKYAETRDNSYAHLSLSALRPIENAQDQADKLLLMIWRLPHHRCTWSHGG